MSDKPSKVENQILHFSKQKKWDKVEAHWAEIVENPPSDPKFYATIALRMIQDGKTEEMKTSILKLIESCQLQEEHKALIQISRGVLHVFPAFEELRDPIIASLSIQYIGNPHLETYLQESGLKAGKGLNESINRFLQLIYCSEGEIFQHGVWGVGKVSKLDHAAQRVIVSFPNHGEKTFTFDGVKEFLKKLPKNHLLAQRLIDPAGLARRAEKDPVEFLKYCMKSLGSPIMQSELKEYLSGTVFNSRQWAAWWSKGRDLFRLDPLINFAGSTGNAKLTLRTEPKSFSEEILYHFVRTDEFSRQYALSQDALKYREKEAVPPDASVTLTKVLKENLTRVQNEPAHRIEYLYLMRDLQPILTDLDMDVDAEANKTLVSSSDPAQVICDVSIFEYQVHAAEHLRDLKPEIWTETAESIFENGNLRLGQWVLRDLIDHSHHDAAAHISEQLLHRPHLNPELFLWLGRAVRDGKYPELQIDMTPAALFSAVIEFIEDCYVRSNRDDPDASFRKGLISRLQNFLGDNHHAIVTDMFQTYEVTEAREKYRALMEHPALGESFKLQLDHSLRAARSDLEKLSDGASEEHFVTAQSYEVKQREYLNIKDVEIPANSKTIGDAARQGDLRENGAYQDARERQKVLFRHLEMLEELLHRARIVPPEHIDTSAINFGTAFKVRNTSSGEVVEYRILGLWDAAPEKHILSYQTPFGQQFLDKKVGDVLTVTDLGGETVTYEIISISNALVEAGAQ